MRSGETTSTCIDIRLLLLALERLGLLHEVVDAADVEEGLLGQFVELAVEQLAERFDGLERPARWCRGSA